MSPSILWQLRYGTIPSFMITREKVLFFLHPVISYPHVLGQALATLLLLGSH